MTRKYFVLILAVTIIACALRLPRLAQRPMHGDEAIHAVKFAELLEHGTYIYDPYDYHGPTLNYLTFIPAWLSSAKRITEVTEFTVRIVPVFMGIALVLLVFLICDGIRTPAAICAALLTAISPAMVFYSRYYIQEMLLVCFTFGLIATGYRYLQSKNILWALFAGIFAGLMHATKETCIIAFGSMLPALIVTVLMQNRKGPSSQAAKSIKPLHLVAALGIAVIISIMYYSSLFTNPQGILDSVRTYTTYFNRAGNNTLHIQPWYYYLRMLVYYRYDNGPIWSEALIVILAAIGFIAVMRKKVPPSADIGLLRFIAFYTLIMTIAYSVITYKTPWCMLSFLHGMILLAGVGAVVLTSLASKKLLRSIIILLLLGATAHLTRQSYLNNYKYYADSSNPYVYAHPTTEVFTMVDRIKYYADANPDGYNMNIDVICPGHDYWPLPWYLRSFTRISYAEQVSENELPAPLIIASPTVEADLRKRFYDESIPFEQRHLYMYIFDESPYYIWLRPKVKLLGFVRKDLWDRAHSGPDPNDLINNTAEK